MKASHIDAISLVLAKANTAQEVATMLMENIQT
jgi:hypothetical protein